MSILINGIDMPTEYGRCMVIFPDGRVTTEFGSQVIAKAVPVPVRHGRWLSMDSEKVIAMDEYGCPVDSCRCSECGDWLTASDEYSVRGRYCPNCGCAMDLEEGM